jgi:hypothetical protein
VGAVEGYGFYAGKRVGNEDGWFLVGVWWGGGVGAELAGMSDWGVVIVGGRGDRWCEVCCSDCGDRGGRWYLRSRCGCRMPDWRGAG